MTWMRTLSRCRKVALAVSLDGAASGPKPRRAAGALVGAALAVTMLGCGGDPEPQAIAYAGADGSLSVVAGTVSRTCANRNDLLIDCGLWELWVHLDATALQLDTPKPLASDETWADNLVADGEPGGRDCLVVGGTFEQGTVELTSLTADSVRFRFSGTEDGIFDADGEYEGPICPAD